MKRFNHSARITLAALIALPFALGASACELIASVDRSLISGSGGDAGAPLDSAGTGADLAGGGSKPSGGGEPSSGGSTSGAAGEPDASGGDSQAAGASGDSGSIAGGSGLGGSALGGGSGAGGAGTSGAAGLGGGSGAGGSDLGGGSGVGGGAGIGGVSGLGGADVGGGSGLGGGAGTAGASGLGGAGGAGGVSSKIIYVTSVPKKANFGGITGADAQCNTSPPNPGSYKALLVDGTTRVACTSAQCATSGAAEGVDWALAPSTKYVREDGTTVIGTTSAAAIFSFPLAASIGTNGFSYWTGLNTDWTTSSDSCSGWTQTSGYFATEGLADTTDSQAILGVTDSCATLAGAFFACVQQ